MEQYFPDTMLLNNIYIPFYIIPTKNIFNCNDNFEIETGSDGITSIINLKETIPFFNLSNYDSETKDWLWFDSNGFPFRIYRHYDGINWVLRPIFNIGQYVDMSLQINPNLLQYDSFGKELGFYTLVTKINDVEVDPGTEIKMYTGKPLILEINGEVISDQTNYGTFENDKTLTSFNTIANKEFFYNSMLNKIYTNQNLTSNDLAQIRVHFFTTVNSVSIKCRLKNNTGGNNYTTPDVDFYVAKLHGQLLKG